MLAHATAQLSGDREKAQADLESVDRELLDYGIDVMLDVAGSFDPTPICDGIACARAIRRGDYLSATLSAVAMLPYFGDGVVKPIKFARHATQLHRVAQAAARAQKALQQLARYQQRLEQFRSLAEYGVNAADSLAHGELPPADDSLALLARMALGRRRMASVRSTLDTIRSVGQDVTAVQNGECPNRAASLVQRIQRGMRRPFDWLTQRTQAATRPFARMFGTAEAAVPAVIDRESYVNDRIRSMALEPAQAQWARLRLAQLPSASSREIVDTLLQAKYP